MLSRALIFFLLYSTLGATPQQLEKLNNEEIRKLPSEADVLVINFWATWCEPCVEEIPVLTKIQSRHKKITVIGISMDESEKENEVRRFIKEHAMGYRVALWTGDDFETMVNSIDPNWDGPIPATFIFQKGKRIYTKTGPITEAELLKHLSH